MMSIISIISVDSSCPEVFHKKGVLKYLFMLFITFKTCLKIENAWFLLVDWVGKNYRLILLCPFHLSMSFFAIFQEETVVSKNAISLVKLLFSCQPRNQVFYFFFFEYLELRLKGKHLYQSFFLMKLQVVILQCC